MEKHCLRMAILLVFKVYPCINSFAGIRPKRINIVSIKMVKEGSIFYDVRQISTPSEAVHHFDV